MKKFVFLLLSALLCKTSFAGNGVHIIGLSAVSRAMGGTGVGGVLNATEALHKNPALLGPYFIPPGEMVFEPMAERTALEFSASATDVNASVTAGSNAPQESSAGLIPNGSVAIARRLDKRFTVGLGIYGYGGAAFDYSGSAVANLARAQDEVRLFRIAPSFAYTVSENFSWGMTPFVSVGTFQLNSSGSTTKPQGDASVGIQLGAWVRPAESIQMGVAYTSAVRHRYARVIDLEPFAGAAANGSDDLTVTQPHDFAFGTQFQLGTNFRLALDYRFVLWGEAEGYGNFSWSNQHVVSFGAEYMSRAWAFRGGYAFATSPLKNVAALPVAGTSPYENLNINNSSVKLLDATVFAGIIQHHITAGVGYALSPTALIDAAFTFSPKSTLAQTNAALTTELTKWVATLSGTFKF